jgi:acyl-CoA synthetase (AMP-forming)/AMP-acid ligase II
MAHETANTFRARIDDEDGEYLRTDDLGFLHEDELFITGRNTDLIVIGGRNLYPIDIEDCIRDAHPLIRPGGIAAFAVDDDNGAGLGLFVETRRDKLNDAQVDELVKCVRRRVHDEHQLACHIIVIGRAGTVRKTTSGKVRRGACKHAFNAGHIGAAAATICVSVAQVQAKP